MKCFNVPSERSYVASAGRPVCMAKSTEFCCPGNAQIAHHPSFIALGWNESFRQNYRLGALGQLLLNSIQAYGCKVGYRFREPYDWKRLFALGVLVCNLAAIALADSMFDLFPLGYRPGQASMFGGLLLAIMMLRIGRPRLYLDWIACGTLHVVLGMLLSKDPHLASFWSFVMFCILLSIAALVTTWMGAALAPRGGLWLAAAGLASLVCVIAAVGGRLTNVDLEPDAVSGVALLLLGLSITGLAVSLKQEARNP